MTHRLKGLSYEPGSVYYARQARMFRRQANKRMVQEQLVPEVQRQGVNPLAVPALSDAPIDDIEVQEQQPRGKSPARKTLDLALGGLSIGFGGKGNPLTEVLNRTGVSDVLLGGDVVEPWDYLRPVKRYLDWEQKNIGKRAVTGVSYLGSAVEAPFYNIRDPFEGFEESQEAFRERQKNNLATKIVTGVAEAVLVPSSLLGAGQAKALLKLGPRGARLARSVPMLESMFVGRGGKQALSATLQRMATEESGAIRFGGRAAEDAPTPEELAFGSGIDTEGRSYSLDYLRSKEQSQYGYLRELSDVELRKEVLDRSALANSSGGAHRLNNQNLLNEAINESERRLRGIAGFGARAPALGRIGQERPYPNIKSWSDRELDETLADIKETIESGDYYILPDETEDIVAFRTQDQLNTVINEITRRGISSKRHISGGADDPTAIVKLLAKVQNGPDDIFAVKGSQEIIDHALDHRSLTQRGREEVFGLVDRVSPEANRVLERNNVRLHDTHDAMLIDDWKRQRAIAGETANASADRMEYMLKEVGLDYQVTPQGDRLINVPGNPTLADFAENMPELHTPAQRNVLETIHEWRQQQNRLIEAAGGRVAKRQTKSGLVFHRQAKGKTVNIGMADDPLDDLTEVVSTGPATKQRFGSKQSIARKQKYTTQAEGIAGGVEYKPFIEAQQDALVQSGYTFSDLWLNHMLAASSKAPTELINPVTKATNVAAAKRLAHLTALEREVSHVARTGAFRGFIQPRGLKNVDPDIQVYLDEAISAANLRKKQERIPVLQGLQDTLRGKLKEQRLKATQAKGQYQTELTQARGGTTDYPVPFRGRLYPQKIGEQITQELGANLGPGGVLDKTVNAFNNAARPLMATLDQSFLGIQGLISFAINPKDFMQAWHYAMNQGAYVEAIKRWNSNGVLASFLRHNGHFADKNFQGEFLFGDIIKKFPGVKTANAWFTRFGNTSRLMLYEGGMEMAQRQGDGALEELARFAGLATGHSTGKPTSIETAIQFAPRFFRSQIGLVADGLTKFGPQDISGAQARRALGSLTMGGIALTYGLNEALGNKTEWNPTNANFLRIRYGGKDISVFGQYDSLVRALVKSAQGAAKGEPFAGPKYFVRTKASPALARLYDLFEGETFTGQDLDWSDPQSIMESSVELASQQAPISIQNVVRGGVPTSIPEALTSASQFTGLKESPLTVSEQRQINRDGRAQDKYQRNWNELEPVEKSELQKKYPELSHSNSTSEAGRAFEARRVIGQEIHDQQLALDAALPPGPEWLEAYKDLRERQAGQYQLWESQHPDEAAEQRNRVIDPKESNASGLQARQDYFNAFKLAQTPWGGMDTDFLGQILDELQSSWTPEQASFVDRNTGIEATPRVKEYRKDQKALREYWEVEDVVWDRLRQHPQLAQYENLDAFIVGMQNEYRQLGVPEEQIAQRVDQLPLVKRVQSLVSKQRQQMRRRDPKIDEIVVRWYGAVPMRGRRAA